jgi:hypothetical protein
MDFLMINSEAEDASYFENRFKEISNKLFNEFVIESHNSLYRITEIEFYWNAPNHIDGSTYKRKYVDPETGQWFFHYSGVDIALKGTNGYGGILLRSVYDIKTNFLYKGPLVCAMRLFSGTNAFEDTIDTKIIKYQFPANQIKQTTRIGLGKNAQENGADKLLYRFIIEVQPIKKI